MTPHPYSDAGPRSCSQRVPHGPRRLVAVHAEDGYQIRQQLVAIAAVSTQLPGGGAVRTPPAPAGVVCVRHTSDHLDGQTNHNHLGVPQLSGRHASAMRVAVTAAHLIPRSIAKAPAENQSVKSM